MDIRALVEAQRAHFESGATGTQEQRIASLDRLFRAIDEHESDWLDALAADLGKAAVEAYATEISPVLVEIGHARRHLGAWMKGRRGKVPALAWPGSARVVPAPCGVVLVIGPWNYPLQLSLMPVVAALAAGNCVVLKPSEHAPHTSRLLGEVIGRVFPQDLVAVVEGGVETAEALLECRFDHVFFTGGSAVGQRVMEAAAKWLTPVTLELGGKCPAIVAGDLAAGGARAIEMAARRIVWGKFLNAGQTCVAPDHVWVDRRVHDGLVTALVAAVAEFYPDGGAGRMVNARHFERVKRYVGDGRIECGGGDDAASLRIEPTILSGVSPSAPVMRDEIFGPVLPVLEFATLDEVLEHLRPASPLAVYLFTGDRAVERQVIGATRSGGVCVNDTVVHITGPDLPFGGVGESGMGRYHGKAGFDTFSRERVLMRRPLGMDPGFRYPPHRISLAALKRVLRFFGGA